jgi:MinD superfamily P-loop ATPase
MKQLVIVSGKGGTGKTSLTAALAHLASSDGYNGSLVMADADVDAANLELVLAPQRRESQDFMGGLLATINPERCAACGDCAHHCRFEAIFEREGEYVVDPLACEGCGVCALVCPNQAVELARQRSGQQHQSISRYGPLVHADLRPAQENSGKLVSQVRHTARQIAQATDKRLILIDGPPGIGCPVIAALTGADMAIIVTEPSLSGKHDLERIAGLVKHFGLPSLVCVNKADLNPEGTSTIEKLCGDRGLHFLGNIPYDPNLPEAMAMAEPITEYSNTSPASQAIRQIWMVIKRTLNTQKR